MIAKRLSLLFIDASPSAMSEMNGAIADCLQDFQRKRPGTWNIMYFDASVIFCKIF
ncbi:MAG TPA: hypothetical protein VMA13_04200 [Candidatus Saccharimonadales bacterium]|nr:hypothetical protein [Candidatus Saccharimonadales bacterium]